MEPTTLNIPVLALRGLTVFPHMSLTFDVERRISIAALERAMEYDPEYGDACFSLAQAYRLNGNNAEAIAAYEKFVELLPNTERANRARRYITELSAQ